MLEHIDRILEVEENDAVRISSNLIVWKEGSSYDLDVTNRQFDDLEKILEEQKGDLFYLIDLSKAKRPSPDMVALVAERLKPIAPKITHAALYTGNNYIMYLGIKFYFIKFQFPSYSAHTTIENALKSFSKWTQTKS